jgi:hypothetical protein
MPNGQHFKMCRVAYPPKPQPKRVAGDPCGCAYYLDDQHFEGCHNYCPPLRGVWSGG